MKAVILLAVAAAGLATAAGATTIANAPAGGSISPFGVPDTQTYGQVFSAPVTGTMTSFTLWLDGGVGELAGGVGTWNGTPAHGFGFGSPTNLYLSAPVVSGGPGSYTFTTSIAVTAGSLYVAYLTVFGVPGATSSTTMPLGDNSDSNILYFVWNNSSDPVGNPSWNYFFDTGDALFEATFTAIPEPGTWAMLIAGFGLVGFAARRRRPAIA